MAGVGLFSMAPYQWTRAADLAVQAQGNAIKAASSFDKAKNTTWSSGSSGAGGALGSLAGSVLGGLTGIPALGTIGGAIGGGIEGGVNGDVWSGIANGAGQGLSLSGSKLAPTIEGWGQSLGKNLFGIDYSKPDTSSSNTATTNNATYDPGISSIEANAYMSPEEYEVWKKNGFK